MDDVPLTLNRTQVILSLADQLLNATVELDEATIDSQFLFRFDPVWYRWVGGTRRLIWLLVANQDRFEPLTMDDNLHLRWSLHIEDNLGVSVGWDSSSGLTIQNVVKNRDGYAPFNKDWATQVWEMRDDKETQRQVWSKIWGEANQISKIHDEIFRLGRAYGLIPLDSEAKDYSENQKEVFHSRVFDWVFWGQITPVFRWPMTQLIESKIGGVTRSLRPFKLPLGYWEDLPDGGKVWIAEKFGNTKRITHLVRIRTWAIYYLTRRGGGNRTEQAAVKLWHQAFPQGLVDVKHFRRERDRLFARGSKKNSPNDSLHIGLSWWDENE